MAAESTAFEGWAILELMGHRRLGGYVSEQEIAGAGLIRIDIPTHPWVNGCTCGSTDPDSRDHEKHNHTCQAFREEGDEKPLDVQATQFYSPAALYCLTPVSEEAGRALRSKVAPVQRWELPALTVGRRDEEYGY